MSDGAAESAGIMAARAIHPRAWPTHPRGFLGGDKAGRRSTIGCACPVPLQGGVGSGFPVLVSASIVSMVQSNVCKPCTTLMRATAMEGAMAETIPKSAATMPPVAMMRGVTSK
jgi:hypothetical protein